MWRLTAVTILAVILGVAALTTQTTSVHACTPATEPIPRIWGEQIVGGRVLSYEVTPLFDQYDESSFLAIERIELAIDEVFFGDLQRLVVSASREAWVGQVKTCGVLAQNLDGEYVIVGLFGKADGTFSMPEVPPLFAGARPSGSEYEAALQYLQKPVLPTTGTGPTASTSTNHLITAVAALGIALLAASFAIRYRPRNKT